MNQPKFKFGDKVRTSKGNVFIISDIRRDAESDYIYNEDRCSGPHFPESELELFKEPQEKKLYAYKLSSHGYLVQFYQFEEMARDPWVRAPEYDIYYPPLSSKP